MSQNIIEFAGDVRIEKLDLVSLSSGKSMNIINQVIGIQIYEDLFTPFISGNIILKDSLDIVGNLPVTGEEVLIMSIRTPTLKNDAAISGYFFVYKLSDRTYLAERSVVYKLHFVPWDAMTDSGTKYSRTFGGKISDTVKKILTDWVGEDRIGTIEETKNATKHTSNFWTPSKNLNFLTNQAVNKAGSPSYIFFENRAGFNFITFNSLYNEPALWKFNYNMKAREILPTGESVRNLQVDYERITNIDLPDSFDTFNKMRLGAYGSTMITHDLATNEYKTKEYNYQDDFKNKLHLNEFPTTSPDLKTLFNARASIVINEIHFDLYDKFGDVSNSGTLQARLSELALAEGFKLNITVPGRTDYTVGQKVLLEIIQPEPDEKVDTKETRLDNTVSGYYLIAAINHNITRENHECSIQLIRDSYRLDPGK